MTARVLLTVSGAIPADLDEAVAAGRRPRADYRVMADAFGADLLDFDEAGRSGGRRGAVIGRVLGQHALLAWETFRRRSRYSVIVTDGEQIGLPLAVLLRLTRRRPGHVMITHIMSVGKKVALFRLFRLGGLIDRFLVYATAQERFLVDELGVDRERVMLTPFMVDTTFFDPDLVDDVDESSADRRPLISSAGLEFRDYPTMIEAVAQIDDVDVHLAVGSPWSRREDRSDSFDLPDNVTVGRLPLDELRDLYARSAVVVVPVVETDFQAGITTILEAMSMGRPVVSTRTTGQTDTIVDGETGLYVPPGDSDALGDAIRRCLDDPEAASARGAAARRWTVEHADVERYAASLAEIVRAVEAEQEVSR